MLVIRRENPNRRFILGWLYNNRNSEWEIKLYQIGTELKIDIPVDPHLYNGRHTKTFKGERVGNQFEFVEVNGPDRLWLDLNLENGFYSGTMESCPIECQWDEEIEAA